MKADVCREIGLVNSMIQTIWKNRTKIISAFEQNERSDVDEALLKWFKYERSDNLPVSGPLHMVNFLFLNFTFKVMYFCSVTLYGNLQF
jgi:hypothetical protein